MTVIEEAKELIRRMRAGQTMNSQMFGNVYKNITGKTWKYTNCAPCIKSNIEEIEGKIYLLETKGGCLDCPKPQEVKEEIKEEIKEVKEEVQEIEIPDTLIPKISKKKK